VEELAPRLRLVVLSDTDPVAQGIAGLWGTLPATGDHVEGAAVRRLGRHQLVVRRPVPHIHDERLDRALPTSVLEQQPTLVFPSVHRSESGQRCLTVHPLGNPGGSVELGGRARTLVPTDPRGMSALLRELDAGATALGVPATYEATHHGPELKVPAFFAEVAVLGDEAPTPAEVSVLAEAIRSFREDASDRVALAVGGGHYAPRFGDLARSRAWAFGHILSRHALEDLTPGTARDALQATPGATGILFARAQDRSHPAFAGLAPTLRENDAPRRKGEATSTSLPTSGT